MFFSFLIRSVHLMQVLQTPVVVCGVQGLCVVEEEIENTLCFRAVSLAGVSYLYVR